MSASNVQWQPLQPQERRWRGLGQRPVIAWLTGLPGAGKTTIADTVDRALTDAGRHTMVLDGDNLRCGINRDLGFTDTDRVENIRRTAEIARLMGEAGLIVIVSLVSPYRKDRQAARTTAGKIPFIEVYVDTPLAVCEKRDPKGLYCRARSGTLHNFTGISATYEPPASPDLTLKTNGIPVTDTSAPLIEVLLRSSAPLDT